MATGPDLLKGTIWWTERGKIWGFEPTWWEGLGFPILGPSLVIFGLHYPTLINFGNFGLAFAANSCVPQQKLAWKKLVHILHSIWLFPAIVNSEIVNTKEAHHKSTTVEQTWATNVRPGCKNDWMTGKWWQVVSGREYLTSHRSEVSFLWLPLFTNWYGSNNLHHETNNNIFFSTQFYKTL